MAVQQIEAWRRDGCSLACIRRLVIVPGLRCRQTVDIHDPVAHELWGRAVAGESAAAAVLESGPLVYSRRQSRIWVSGREVILTRVEMTIFRAIVDGGGAVVRQGDILAACWGESALHDTHLLRTNISRMRGRLGEAAGLFETITGVGLRFLFVTPGETAPPIGATLATSIVRAVWARNYTECQRCHLSDSEHAGHGYCERCRAAMIRLRNREANGRRS